MGKNVELACYSSLMAVRENVLVEVFKLLSTDGANDVVWTRFRLFNVPWTLFFRR